MDPNLSMHHVCRAVRHWKERLVATGGVGADISPAVVTLAGPNLVGAYDLGALHGPARDASVIAAIALSDCDRAVLCYEAYISISGDYPPNTDLAPQFAAGDPSVAEAVVMNFVTRDGFSTDRTFPYTYAGRKVQWQSSPSPVNYAHSQIARQVQLMLEGFERQADRGTGPVLTPGAQLHLVGEEVMEHVALVSFAVTAPCPCGSQQPIEQCCAKWN